MDANKIKKGLGRGLSSLIGETNSEININKLPLSELVSNKYQPRKIFDEDSLQDLTNSIKERGVIQPIIVRKSSENNSKYEIIAGERRWLAAQRAGLHEVPVVITNVDDLKSLEFAIVENVLRLLSLPETILELIENKKLTPGHAKILVGLENSVFVANKIIEKNLSVRQAENFVKIFKTNKQSHKTKQDPNLKVLQESVVKKIGLNVLIKNKKNNTGSILFEYKDIDQLNKIIDIIKTNY